MQLETYKKREKNNVGDSTLNSRMSALRRFKSFVGEDREAEVEDVEEWIDHLVEEYEKGNVKSSTISQYFKAVKYYFETVLNLHGDLEHIRQWIPSAEVDHGEYLTVDEWNKLRNNVHKFRDRAIIEIMYWYARRPGEVRLLNTEDIDFEEGTITFNILKKERDDRGELLPMMELQRDGETYEKHRVFRATFEIVDEVRFYLRQHLTYAGQRKETIIYDGEEMEVHPVFSANHARMDYHTLWRMFKKEVRAAGIDKNVTPKGARHSRATHLNWDGHTPEEIADQQLIHDPETDVIGAYVHPRDEEDVRKVMGTGEDEE